MYATRFQVLDILGTAESTLPDLDVAMERDWLFANCLTSSAAAVSQDKRYMLPATRAWGCCQFNVKHNCCQNTWLSKMHCSGAAGSILNRVGGLYILASDFIIRLYQESMTMISSLPSHMTMTSYNQCSRQYKFDTLKLWYHSPKIWYHIYDIA